MQKSSIPFPSFARRTASSLLALLALGACALAGDELPPGKARFALMGDTPYSPAEVRRLDGLIDALNAEPLAFVVHVGDITSGRGPCTDEWFAARKAQFARISAAFVLLPGDNDWTDCHRSGFDPLERLRAWRKVFCPSSTSHFRLERQEGEYCEHVRWTFGGLLFVALNVQGSNNNRGRTPEMDREYEARMAAVMAWIDDSEKALGERKLEGLVLLMQANPFLKPRTGESGFEGLLARLRALGAAHPGRVTLVNGDTHTYRDDEPIPGVHRVEVYGSPFVSYLRAAAQGSTLSAEPAGQF